MMYEMHSCVSYMIVTLVIFSGYIKTAITTVGVSVCSNKNVKIAIVVCFITISVCFTGFSEYFRSNYASRYSLSKLVSALINRTWCLRCNLGMIYKELYNFEFLPSIDDNVSN